MSSLSDALSWRRLLLATVLLGRCLCLAMPLLGDVFAWRCISWAMSLLGDAFLGRCLCLAMPQAVNLLTFFLGSHGGSYHMPTLTFDPRPGTGRYNSPPRLLKNHDFTYSTILLATHKKPIHPTWLSQNPTKINNFYNQTFHTTFCIHLWHFSTKIAQKTWLHFFTNFATKTQKANPPNLAKPKPNQEQFLLQPNFWHLILDAFVTILHQDCSKTMTSIFHHFCYQNTKTRPNDQTCLSQNPTKVLDILRNHLELVMR